MKEDTELEVWRCEGKGHFENSSPLQMESSKTRRRRREDACWDFAPQGLPRIQGLLPKAQGEAWEPSASRRDIGPVLPAEKGERHSGEGRSDRMLGGCQEFSAVNL